MDTVLIIDRHESRRNITQALQKAGFLVVEAVESEDGLDLLRDTDLVLLSEDMPSVGSQELLADLRMLNRDVWVIVMGSGDGQVAAHFLEQGADNYIRRPVNPVELVVLMKASLRRRYDLIPE